MAMVTVVLGALLLLLGSGGLAPFRASADVFCDNLKLVATALPRNISTSPVHFATTAFGQAPDVVYALALCRGDVVNGTGCGECVASTFQRILNWTPPPDPPAQCYRAFYYYADPCPVFYTTEDIITPTNDTAASPFVRWNEKNVTGDVDLVVGLTQKLLVETVDRAATATPGRFATGVMDSGTAYPLVYSMAQCTPDLSAGDCSVCLRRLLGMVNSTMVLRMGAQIHVVHCYFRYEAYQFYDSQPMLSLGPASAPALTPAMEKNKRHFSKLWAIPIVLFPLAAGACLCFVLYSRQKKMQRKGSRHTRDLQEEGELVWQGKNSEFSVYELDQILEATNNFSEENKLGQGGFGSVYKGQFPEGVEIAVKRLASHSGQGFTEFKNEVQLIAKLQHRNLVRLLGCCSEEDEKILVYEYLPNKSLDFFIFDDNKRALLDWSELLAVIEGIAHGLNYLHKHSRLRIIHRDLKPSNILLDNEMNPKISDFGLAKIYSSTNNEGNTTRRVVGTYGYMAPEYASEGMFSIKSDVFSFGVIILEIVSGKRNSGTHQCGDFINLLGYAWQLWNEERWNELVDSSLLPKDNSEEMVKCINIALLCVQENAADRPTMSDVIAMLSSEPIILAEPKKPAHFNIVFGFASGSY
ncbi:hypothetical protein QOZ80_2AG0119150 [Eleusine coracana subsp. coracana]|nr:hypothetical protein QOZ80_2AG0119150 [Eleusine coracana subsp. coracana]